MIGGVIPVLYSFYGKSGTLDLAAHEQQIAWVLAGQASGVTLLGLASEGASLTPDERKAVVRVTAQRLPAAATLLVTTRPDDDLRDIAQIALESRGEVGLIVQIGRDPAPSIRQIQDLSGDASMAAGVRQALPDIVARLSFLKAEYNSSELDAHLRALPKRFDVLVGRHGQNFIDYLRIGATGVIPGTEMTAPLRPILSEWTSGRHDEAIRRYGTLAGYVDFAMQDLDMVIDIGRAVTARALGFDAGSRRQPAGRDGVALEAAVDFWFARWQTLVAR